MKSNQMPQPKKVRFMDDVTVHDVKGIDEYTPDERAQIWITSSDYSRIRKENKVIIDMIEDGFAEEDREDTSFRGLENKCTVGNKYRRNIKQEAMEAVLYAQEAQHDERRMGHELDWEPIREAYVSLSSECKTAAEEVGLADACKAWRSYQKTQVVEDVEKVRRPRTVVKTSLVQPQRRFSHVF